MTVLTGAGVSAASGVPTFRGAGGLWRSFRAEDLATPEAFARDPALVWEWYEWRRATIAACQPNAAHDVLARWTRDSTDCTVITQNVDDLHLRAGTQRLVRLHGSIWELACWNRCGIAPVARRARAPPGTSRDMPRLRRPGPPGRRLVWRVAVTGRHECRLGGVRLRRLHRGRNIRRRLSGGGTRSSRQRREAHSPRKSTSKRRRPPRSSIWQSRAPPKSSSRSSPRPYQDSGRGQQERGHRRSPSGYNKDGPY